MLCGKSQESASGRVWALLFVLCSMVEEMGETSRNTWVLGCKVGNEGRGCKAGKVHSDTQGGMPSVNVGCSEIWLHGHSPLPCLGATFIHGGQPRDRLVESTSLPPPTLQQCRLTVKLNWKAATFVRMRWVVLRFCPPQSSQQHGRRLPIWSDLTSIFTARLDSFL